MKLISHICIALALSLCAAIYGLGFSYNSFITPLESRGELTKIGGDRWLEDGATVTLQDLSTRGNRLLVSFKTWRPAGSENNPANITASVCGTPASSFNVTTENPFTIFLTGSCEPREIEFKVRNPLAPTKNDSRLLGAQVNYFKVTSILGVPILSLKYIALASAAIFILAGLIYFSASLVASLVTFPIAARLLSFCQNLSFTPAIGLWIFISALTLGILLKNKIFPRYRIEITASSFSVTFLFLTLIIFVAFALRLYGISFGLPFNYHPDEVPKFNAIQRMRSFGDLNPRYFLHPSMLLYATYFANSLRQFFAPTNDWYDTLILSGRYMSAVAGTLSVLLTFLIGKSLFNSRTALIGAALLAVSPLHVTCSRYVKEDALLTFFVLLCAYLVVTGSRRANKNLIYLAGLAAGAAASTKYPGVLTGFLLLGAPFLNGNSWRAHAKLTRATVFAFLAIPIGFFIFSPYTILDLPTFLRDIASEQEHMLRGHMAVIDAWSQLWMYHFSRSILPGLTMLTATCCTVGLGYLLAKRDPLSLYVICAFLLYYLPAEYVKAKPAPQPERYIMPTLPFLALAGGVLVEALIARSRIIGIALFAVILLIPMQRTAALASEIKNDTRDQMKLWIEKNIPDGTTIMLDWKPYNPPLSSEKYNLEYLPREDIISNLLVSRLKRSDADYLILSSLYFSRYFDQPNAEPAFRQVFRDLFAEFPKVITFTAPHGTYGFHNPELTLLDLKKSLTTK